MEFVCYNQWSQLPERAKLLFKHAECRSMFLSQAWFENVTAHALEENQSILIACVVEDQDVLAILPMLECSQGSLSSLSSRFTTSFSVLLNKPQANHNALACLAQGLAKLPHHPIRLEPIDSQDENILQLRALLEKHSFKSNTYFRFYNWSHLVNGKNFSEYINDRPTSLINTIQRKQRKFVREHDFSIQLYTDKKIDKAIADYKTVYRASWKANEFFSRFTPSLIRKFASLGWLRLAVIYAAQQPIAAQIWFVVHGKANIYRLAYDEKWKLYSPGSILTYYLMQHVIDTDKVSEIDFLTGDEKYKKYWMTTRKELMGIVLAKRIEQKNKWKDLIYSIKTCLLSSNSTKYK